MEELEEMGCGVDVLFVAVADVFSMFRLKSSPRDRPQQGNSRPRHGNTSVRFKVHSSASCKLKSRLTRVFDYLRYVDVHFTCTATIEKQTTSEMESDAHLSWAILGE